MRCRHFLIVGAGLSAMAASAPAWASPVHGGLAFALLYFRHTLFVFLCAALFALVPRFWSAQTEARRVCAGFLSVILLVVLAGICPFGAGLVWLGGWGLGVVAFLAWAGIWILVRKPKWSVLFPSAGLTGLFSGAVILASTGHLLPLLAAEIFAFVCLLLWMIACRKAETHEDFPAPADLDIRRAKEEAVSQERQRYIQDMHDGLGANLVSLLAAVKNRKMSPDDVAQGLQECLDEMRLVIDARGVGTEDLGAALANVRYRMEPRMRAAGIELKWDILGLPDDFRMNQDKTVCVLRVLQESMANAVKYSRASRQTIRMSANEDGEFELQVEDDGIGIKASQETSRAQGNGLGLKGMQKRTADLGGNLQFGQGDSGTGFRICLRLPAN